MDFVSFRGMPLPPSINEAYLNRAGFQGRGRIKSPKYRTFERAMFGWKLGNSLAIGEAAELITADACFRVDVDFWLPYSRVLTKAGKPKRHDVDNRLKIFNDALSLTLGFDDSRIARQTIQKIACRSIEVGHVDVTITREAIAVAD